MFCGEVICCKASQGAICFITEVEALFAVIKTDLQALGFISRTDINSLGIKGEKAGFIHFAPKRYLA